MNAMYGESGGSGRIVSYRDLRVWHMSMELAEQVYVLTKLLPPDEKYGLVSQLRRAVVSIPSNIAEGCARNSTKEYIHHVSYALGSLAEVETQLLLTIRLGMIEAPLIETQLMICSDLGKMLQGLRAKLLTGSQRLREEPDADYEP